MVKAIVVLTLVSIMGGNQVVAKREQSRRDSYLSTHQELIPEMKLAISQGRLRLGMNSEQVLASWGIPANVYRNGAGCEYWWYRRFPRLGIFPPHAYLYFEEGRLVNWKSTA